MSPALPAEPKGGQRPAHLRKAGGPARPRPTTADRPAPARAQICQYGAESGWPARRSEPRRSAARRAVIWRWARWRRSCSRGTATLITGWPCRSSTVPCFYDGSAARSAGAARV